MWMLALYIGQYLCENELYSCISACGTDYIHFILLLSGSGITLGCCKQLINWCPKHDSIGQEGCILFLKVIRMALRILMHDYLIIGVWSAKAFSVKCFSATRLSEMALLRLIGVWNMIKSCLGRCVCFQVKQKWSCDFTSYMTWLLADPGPVGLEWTGLVFRKYSVALEKVSRANRNWMLDCPLHVLPPGVSCTALLLPCGSGSFHLQEVEATQHYSVAGWNWGKKV